MNQNKLFNQTRLRLAFWYASVMGLILALLGFGVYKAIAHAHWVALDRELKSVAGTLHDSLELKLEDPGKIEPIIQEILPNLRLIEGSLNPEKLVKNRHILSAIHQGHYYIRLFNNSGKLIAIAGDYPEGISEEFKQTYWQQITDSRGINYQQISLALHTQDREDWGYFQVGRSLKDFQDYLDTVKWALKFGFPAALILIAISGWGLAGLAMQPIDKSYRQIQQFTADVAHELRTPLAATQATVESALLMPDLEEKEAREILKIIEHQNRRLIQLVTDLLLLSRMERQPKGELNQCCCLQDLINDLVEELAALAMAAEVTLTSDLRESDPLEVFGNPDQLYRLVSNLIINGIQYTPAGGKVTVILERIYQDALIFVEDTGLGIAPEEQARIFDRFYRVYSDRSRETGGAGLGLAIAQRIAQAHQGSLTVQSELGRGSTFILRLPLRLSPH